MPSADTSVQALGHAPLRRLPLYAVLVLVWMIPATLAVFETYTFARLSGRPFVMTSIVVREGTTWMIYGLLAPLVYKFANRYPLRAPSLLPNLARHFSAAMITGLVAAAAATAATRLTPTTLDAAALRAMSGTRLFMEWFLGDLPITILSYFAVVGVAHAVSYFYEAQQQREVTLRLERQLSDARLATLRGRLHPHFLYNALNAITVLVRDCDITRSIRMLELLSTMLRRILDTSLPQVIALENEIALLRQYLEIEEVRFSDRLIVSIDIEPRALSAGVPTLVAQPLAENVIRHAVARTSRPVRLTIAARIVFQSGVEVLELSVADDGPGLLAGWERRSTERTGLSATTLRLATLYGQTASLELRPRATGGAIAVILIPYTVTATAPGAWRAAAEDLSDESEVLAT